MGKKSRSKKEARIKNKYSKLYYEKEFTERVKRFFNSDRNDIKKKSLSLKNPMIMELENYHANIVEIYSLCCEYIKHTNDYHNYFIADNAVTDFVTNNHVNTKDYYHTQDIIKSICKERTNNIMDTPYYSGAFHFIDRKYSIFFCCMYDPNEERNVLIADTVNNHTNKALLATVGLAKEWNGTEGHVPNDSYNETTRESSKEALDTIANLFFYMDVFPESVIDGVPPMQDVEGNTIKANKKLIVHHTGSRLSPHLRRGHFRFLKSDVYKNKRYQTVYVKPTMVKGHASHIVEGGSE